MLVDGGEEHGGICLEYGLRAVSVVDVEIRDRYTGDSTLGLSGPGRGGYVVDHTKAHGSIGQGVVARGPNQGEAAAELALCNGQGEIDQAADGTRRRIEAPGREPDPGICIPPKSAG